MAISDHLQTFLQTAKVKYTVMKHPVVYTAQEIAAAQHVPGKQLAKCVLVKTDRGPLLAVLPAIHLIHLKKLKILVRAKTLTIAKEADIKARFPDVEVGAMSPFGNLYQVPVAVDRALGESAEIVSNAGSHTETIKIRYEDFVRLVKPTVGPFGRPIGGKKPVKTKKKRGTSRRGAKSKRASRPRVTSTRRSRNRSTHR